MNADLVALAEPCPTCDDSGWAEFCSGGIWTGERITTRQEPCTCICGDDVRRELRARASIVNDTQGGVDNG